MPTYFATGVSGFVGSRFALDCAQKGIKVRALVRDAQKAQRKLKTLPGATPEILGRITFVQGDLLSPESYADHLAGCEAVYHAGAKVGYLGKFLEYLHTNHTATVDLAVQAKASGVKHFVYLSSQAAVRPVKWRFWRSEFESEVLGPQTPYPSPLKMLNYPYGLAKARAERDLLSLSDISFAVTIFRPHVIWGIGDSTLASMLVEMAKGPAFAVINGPYKCASTHIDTLLYYSHAALEAESPRPGTYHVLDKSNMTMNQWLDSYTRVLSLPKPKRLPYHLAYPLAAGMELVSRLVGLFKPGFALPLDRFVVDGMGRPMNGDMRPTIKAFGKQPEIDVALEMRKFADWYTEK